MLKLNLPQFFLKLILLFPLMLLHQHFLMILFHNHFFLYQLYHQVLQLNLQFLNLLLLLLMLQLLFLMLLQQQMTYQDLLNSRFFNLFLNLLNSRSLHLDKRFSISLDYPSQNILISRSFDSINLKVDFGIRLSRSFNFFICSF